MQIILIPGLMNDGWVWHQQIGALSRLGPVTVARTDGCDSLAAMAARIVAETAGPMAVIGHSMGGRVALEVAVQAPSRVKALGLLNTGVHGPAEKERAGRTALVDLARAEGMAAVAAEWMPPMLAPANRGDAALAAGITAMLGRCDPDDFAGQQAALMGRTDRTPLIPRLDCPILAVSGADDIWSPPEQHQAIADAAKQGQFAVVPGAGHMLPVEAPDGLTDVLTGFLRGLG